MLVQLSSIISLYFFCGLVGNICLKGPAASTSHCLHLICLEFSYTLNFFNFLLFFLPFRAPFHKPTPLEFKFNSNRLCLVDVPIWRFGLVLIVRTIGSWLVERGAISRIVPLWKCPFGGALSLLYFLQKPFWQKPFWRTVLSGFECCVQLEGFLLRTHQFRSNVLEGVLTCLIFENIHQSIF